ncbi:MAG: 30S ribosomal protein S16 [Coriobacteriia bacterium]|nr:30S ribosomal protein S16 [Coriobacteriia bacterium]
MAVRIRLARHGAKKTPYYRVIVTDAHSRRDGSFIEEVGRYNPCANPTFIQLDVKKIDSWIEQGAQPTDTVERILKIARAQAES